MGEPSTIRPSERTAATAPVTVPGWHDVVVGSAYGPRKKFNDLNWEPPNVVASGGTPHVPDGTVADVCARAPIVTGMRARSVIPGSFPDGTSQVVGSLSMRTLPQSPPRADGPASSMQMPRKGDLIADLERTQVVANSVPLLRQGEPESMRVQLPSTSTHPIRCMSVFGDSTRVQVPQTSVQPPRDMTGFSDPMRFRLPTAPPKDMTVFSEPAVGRPPSAPPKDVSVLADIPRAGAQSTQSTPRGDMGILESGRTQFPSTQPTSRGDMGIPESGRTQFPSTQPTSRGDMGILESGRTQFPSTQPTSRGDMGILESGRTQFPTTLPAGRSDTMTQDASRINPHTILSQPNNRGEMVGADTGRSSPSPSTPPTGRTEIIAHDTSRPDSHLTPTQPAARTDTLLADAGRSQSPIPFTQPGSRAEAIPGETQRAIAQPPSIGPTVSRSDLTPQSLSPSHPSGLGGDQRVTPISQPQPVDRVVLPAQQQVGERAVGPSVKLDIAVAPGSDGRVSQTRLSDGIVKAPHLAPSITDVVTARPIDAGVSRAVIESAARNSSGILFGAVNVSTSPRQIASDIATSRQLGVTIVPSPTGLQGGDLRTPPTTKVESTSRSVSTLFGIAIVSHNQSETQSTVVKREPVVMAPVARSDAPVAAISAAQKSDPFATISVSITDTGAASSIKSGKIESSSAHSTNSDVPPSSRITVRAESTSTRATAIEPSTGQPMGTFNGSIRIPISSAGNDAIPLAQPVKQVVNPAATDASITAGGVPSAVRSVVDVSVKAPGDSTQESQTTKITRTDTDAASTDSHLAATDLLPIKRLSSKKRYTFGAELAIFMAAASIAKARNLKKIKRATILGDVSATLNKASEGETIVDSGAVEQAYTSHVHAEKALGAGLFRKSSNDNRQSESSQPLQAQPLYRPAWLISKGETLVSIAQAFFDDADIAWLIADLNIEKLIESYIDGKRVIEVRSRQKLELPVPDDIVEFYASRPRGASADNLITIVNENQLDTDVQLASVLSMFNSTAAGSLGARPATADGMAFHSPFGGPVAGAIR